MLEQLRNNTKSGIIYFLFGIIIIVFIFTFNTSGPGGGCTGGEEWPAASVNGEVIYLSDLELGMRLSANPPANPLDSFGAAVFQGTRFARLGLSRPDLPTPFTAPDTFTRSASAQAPLKAAKVADDLVESFLIAQEAENMGLRVTDKELALAVKEWITTEQGEFSSEIYSNTIRYGLGTTRQKFEGLLNRELLRRKLVQLVASQATVDPAEVTHYTTLMTEKATVRYAKVDAVAVAGKITVSAQEAAAFAKDNGEKITAEYEARKAEFNQDEKVLLSGIFKKAPFPAQIENEADPAKKAELEASRQDAKAALEAIAADLATGEKAQAVAQAAAAAAAAQAAAEAGTDNPEGEAAAAAPAEVIAKVDLFKKNATESSDDATKSNGGLFSAPLTKADLGRYPYGETVAEAAFALNVGDVSTVVEVNRGFWLLRLEEKVPAFSKTEAEVANDLATSIIQREKAPGEVEAVATALLEKAKATPVGDLTQIAQQMTGTNITVSETLPLARMKQLGDSKGWKQVGGLGCAPDLVTAAFTLNEKSPLAPAVYTVFGGPNCDEDTGTRVVAQWVSNPEVTEEEVSEAKTAIENQLAAFNAREIYRAWYENLQKNADVEVTGNLEEYLRLQETAVVASQAPLQ